MTYRAGNIYDKQRMNTRGFDQSLLYNPQGAMGMEGVAPKSGNAYPSYKPEGGGMGMQNALAMAGYLPLIAGDVAQAFKAPKYDTTVQGGDWTGYNPQHGLGDEIKRAASIDTNNWITQSTGQNAMKFAGTGGQIGSMFGPLGSLIGTGAGALVGAVTGFFGGRRKKKKAEEQKADLLKKTALAAESFSDVNIEAKQEQQAKRIALEKYYS